MSTWRVWCVDGDDERVSREDSDLFVTWRWLDHWTLEAILPENDNLPTRPEVVP